MGTPTVIGEDQPGPGPALAGGAGSEEPLPEGLSELGLAFKRVFRLLGRLRGRDTHLVGSELTHAQFELLSELHERGPLPAGELAAAALMAPGTVTQMLDHLAAAGQVERVRSETDRRVVVSRLTAQGRRKIEAKREAWAGRWRGALQGMPAEDLAAATRVLERLAAMLEQDPPDPAAHPLAGAAATDVADPPETANGR